MQKITLLLAPLTLSVFGCSSHLNFTNLEATQVPADIPLADLRTWDKTGNATWKIEAHYAESLNTDRQQGVSGYLISPDSHTNFMLSVEFWIDDETNSGLFVRCQDRQSITPLNCYEANIWDNHPNQGFRTGSIVTLVEPSVKVHTIGRWNRYEILARDNRVIISVNGTQTAELNSDTHATGFIALQYDGKRTVKFRDLRILEY